MRLCTLYRYIRCRGAAANTRVSSYCMSIQHPEMNRRHGGVASDPRLEDSVFSTDLLHDSSPASTYLGYSSSRTSAASTPSTSHLVERYQKMTMRSHEESKLNVYLNWTIMDCCLCCLQTCFLSVYSVFHLYY